MTLPNGEFVAVELAEDAENRAQGLMYRESLPAGRGMLFVFPAAARYPFWMKNMNFAIDIIWLDREGIVVDVKESVPPCREETCPNYTPANPALYVLELVAGKSAATGVRKGRKLALPIPGG